MNRPFEGIQALEGSKKKSTFIKTISSLQMENQKKEFIEDEELDVPGEYSQSNDFSIRVLIVDDDAFNIMSLEMILTKKGINCCKAFNGRQAIDLLLNYYQGKTKAKDKDKDFSLIFMDLNMPVMDGLTCSKNLVELIEQGKLPDIPIIGCSANESQKDIQNCRDAGMSGFPAKPVTIFKLTELLKLYI
jgi:CheY-like chemotaxis protein